MLYRVLGKLVQML